MGIDYKAVVIVGLPVDDLCDHENFEEWRDNSLYQAPPYYDGSDEAILGILAASSPWYSAEELTESLDEKIEKARDSFKKITGLDGKVYLTPVGY